MAFTFAARPTDSRALDADRQLLFERRILSKAMKDVIEIMEDDATVRSKLLLWLRDALPAFAGIDIFIRERTDRLLWPEYCPEKAKGLAQQVFNIPELLELILSRLEIDELLGAQFINRQFRDAVETSTKLQRSLSLTRHLSRDFYAPFAAARYPNFKFLSNAKFMDDSIKHKKANRRRMITIHAKFDHELPIIGPKCRRMLVVQPPIHEMNAFTNCCQYSPEGRVQATVRNEAGVTIGDLLDTATELKASHRECRHAGYRDHDYETGEVKVVTTFQARVLLRQDDPTLVARKQEEAARKERRRKKTENVDMIEDFVDSKLSAFMAGQPAPVFKEWREAYVPHESDSEEDVFW